MESRSLSRCVAIAAHGKRCQQSPFRGSPYCWHHTQSRKIWAPSRPLGSGSSAKAVAPPPVDDVATRVPERRTGDRRAARASPRPSGRSASRSCSTSSRARSTARTCWCATRAAC